MQVTIEDKSNGNRKMTFPQGMANLLLTSNPQRWHKSAELPKVEATKEVVVDSEQEEKPKRGRKAKK